MISCCGILDVLTFDQAQHNLPAALQHFQVSLQQNWGKDRHVLFQQEDLIGLGRIVVALACNSLAAAVRENLASSIAYIAQNYSQDLKNLVTFVEFCLLFLPYS